MRNFTIDRNRFNKKGQELYDLLIEIMPREDYIYFVMALAKGDENRQIVIDYIKNKNPDWAEIVKFANEKW